MSLSCASTHTGMLVPMKKSCKALQVDYYNWWIHVNWIMITRVVPCFILHAERVRKVEDNEATPKYAMLPLGIMVRKYLFLFFIFICASIALGYSNGISQRKQFQLYQGMNWETIDRSKKKKKRIDWFSSKYIPETCGSKDDCLCLTFVFIIFIRIIIDL